MTKSLYQDYFGIRENPFSIIPDPHYLYMGPRHQEALAHLLFGVGEGGGFVLLTGEVGTGKTTVCRALTEQLPERVDLALILNPKLGELELMSAICDEMHIVYPEETDNLKGFFDLVNRHLLDAHSRGRNPVLLIDEAQALPEESIELVRLLTNLETSEKKLLQIILVGQPELNTILAQPHFRQTAQRITARYHLGVLGLADCKKYIDHRLHVAGMNDTVFSVGAIKIIQKNAGGIPRLINSICDRAMLGAYANGSKKVSRKIASMAAGEVLGRGPTPGASSVWMSGAAVMLIALFSVFVAIDPMGYGFKEKIRKVTYSMFAEMNFSAVSIKPQVIKPEKVITEILTPPKQIIKNEIKIEEPIAPIAENKTPVPSENNLNTPDEDVGKTSLLNELTKSGTLEIAFVKLFNLWEKDYLKSTGVTPCDKAQDAGLSCMQGTADIKGLRAINRPALVSFSMPNGESLYGVITQIKNKEAGGSNLTIEFDERQITMLPNALALRWKGDYLVLWKQPEYYIRPLSVGIQGDDVVKARQLLAISGYGDAPLDSEGRGSQFFGTTMQSKVMSFQRDFGLTPDGIIGSETLLKITGSVGSVNGPSIVWEE